MIRFEYFTLVEKYGPVGITASEMADRLGISIQVARNWLSRWAKAGYLELVSYPSAPNSHPRTRGKKGRPAGHEGRYRAGKKDWSDLVGRPPLGEGELSHDF